MTKQPTIRDDSLLPETYKGLLKEIKDKVRSSQLKAAIAVNQEMIKLYWDIGSRLLEKQKNEQEMKECKDPELRAFFEEMITLMHAMRDSSYKIGDDKSEMQAVVMRWTELYRKYHNKFDFNFQKNLITAANMHGYTLDIYEVQDPVFRKEVIQWAEDLVKRFPKEPSSYAVLASVKAMNGSKKDEVLPVLEKGLALNPQNQECLNVMKNYR